MAASPATQPESAIIALLTAGLDEGKPSEAIAEVQKWLRQNQPQDAMLLYLAGRAAELSGDWKGAAAFYQQYLKKADLKSDAADEAVYAVYVLLIDRLQDLNAAFAFGRNEGNRLMGCPRARQFDRWFLDYAVERGDAEAVAARLLACVKAGLPNDLLVARYDSYFRWLLDAVDHNCEQPRGVPVTRELYDGIKGLCEALTFDDEMKLRLDWAVSVKAYNLARIGGDGSVRIGRGKSGKGGKKADGAQEPEEKETPGDVPPPIAEATALLAKYPQYAVWVQTGWAGGGNGKHYRNEPKKYWPHEVDAKMAPVLAAVPRLDPIRRADLMRSWSSGFYNGGPNVLEVKAVRDYLTANPELLNGRMGPFPLEKSLKDLTLEEAQKWAPRLAQVSDPQASLVRAIAAGGKDLDKVMSALLGPEVWRLGQTELDGRPPYVDMLWHYCGRPGDSKKRDEEIAKSKAVAATLAAGDIKKEAPAAQRMAAFKRLWDDYRSPQPKMPDVYGRLVNVLQFTPELVPELLRDPSPEAQILVRDAMEKGIAGPGEVWAGYADFGAVNVRRYDPCILRMATHHRGMAQLKRQFPQKYRPHPLEAVLRQAVDDLLKHDKAEPWLTMAWINTQFPENNAESIKLMQALLKSPAWKSLPFEVQSGAREWFKKDAMTPAQFAWIEAADPALACKDLLALPNDADVATTAVALGRAIEGVKNSPIKIDLQGLDRLAAVTNDVFTDPKVTELVLAVTDTLRESGRCDKLGARLLALMSKKRESVQLHRTATYLWKHASYATPDVPFSSLRGLAESLIDAQPSAAGAMGRIGSQLFVEMRGNGTFKPEQDLPALKAIVVKAAMKMGLMVIPVAQTDPAYPVYKSQAEWLSGNEDSAWTLCNGHWEQLLPVHRELSMDYLMWLLQRTIYVRDGGHQEELVKALLAWAKEPNTPLSPTQKIELELAYGDIAIQRGMLKQAHEIFTRAAQNKAYDGLLAQHEATLRRVRVERMSKDFDAALQTLSELEMKRVPEMWAPARYARAEVYYDMEEYDNAAADIESILAREPTHAEAKIMQGKLQLKRQKLMEATEVELGTVSSQQALVPGEKLKVTLTDPTLAVSGAGTEIEVVVWATSGDKERFFLRQFGDQKTKFRGEVATALGAPHPDDRVLQVVGDDQVFYAYSERFRKKMNDLDEKRGGPITVASDALLMASARKLRSEAEQRVADMEAQMAELNGKGGSEPGSRTMIQSRKAPGALHDIGSEVEAQAREMEALQKRLLAERVKPGNPIYVRVIDPDRSRTAGIDELIVSLESSSGDSVGQVLLKETGTHTGWFEGQVATTGAQAMAFAESSKPGRNPNMVISPADGYPAWRPVSARGKVPSFKVDLNDNVSLGEMTIVAKEQGSKLKKFVLLTGMNAEDMTAVAVYPKDLISIAKPWCPSVTIMNDTDAQHVHNDRSVHAIRELEEQLDRGWMTQTYAQGVAENVVGPSEAMANSIPGKVEWKRQDRSPTSHVIYRFRGYFYEPDQVTRRFRLDLGAYAVPPKTHPSVNHPAQFMLAVDGRPITKKEEDKGKLEGEADLRPGVHRFEIWATGWNTSIGFGRSIKLLANLNNPETLTDCPDRFFDPETFPNGVLAQRNAPATIMANADGTEFKVKFSPESRARLLNLVFLAQESPEPALNKIRLADAGGKQVLPVARDFAELNKNDRLEILTGDTVAVRYVDDRYVTRSKEKHERFLHVAFTSARMQFEFFEMRKNRLGEDEAYYERMLRFTQGNPVLLTIEDADMDVSAKPDTLSVTLESKAGGKRTFVATESGESTGIFRILITPVAGTPTKDNEIQTGENDTLTATYRDEENTDPGIPVDRCASIRHAAFATPELRLSNTTANFIEPGSRPGARGLNEGFTPRNQEQVESSKMSASARRDRSAEKGLVQPRWNLVNELHSASAPPAKGFEAVLGQRMYFEVVAPHLALRTSSNVQVYAQTDAGRKQALPTPPQGAVTAEKAQRPDFDIHVPGTMQLSAGLTLPSGVKRSEFRDTPQISIYVDDETMRGDGKLEMPFTCSVPLITGVLPDHGVLTREEIAARRKANLPPEPGGLVVQPGERVHIGFRYEDRNGVERWITSSAKVVTHPVLDVMEEDYRVAKTKAYVGETLYLRVVDLGADVTDRSDAVRVLVEAKSGAKYPVELHEVDTHTGVFKGVCWLSYAKTGKSAATDAGEYDVKTEGFPVVYDDVMRARYTDASGRQTETLQVNICKGADGGIQPFSKKYEDPDIAMRTQFSLAESFLEVAKHHRELGESEAAGREYERAKQMLASVMDQFRDPETRAHAEYLLGSMTQEEADTTTDRTLQEERYRAALSRFMNVTGSYPDTIHASKAQFKIATVYERLKEPEIAAQEYVKLAYKYPHSEFLAVAMARLGTHFLNKAAEYEKQAKALLEKTGDKDAQFEGTARNKMATEEYRKSATIFVRLQSSFPDHELAGKGGLRGGQAYMRAGDNRLAVNVFLRVIANEAYDGPEIRAQAMYWAGMCYENLKEAMAAYSMYKRLTFDFPESKWASYARAQLSQDGLLNLENTLEIKRLEEGR